MDYIIFGLGAGATLLLVGWLFRDYGPWLRDRSSGKGDHLFSAQQLIDQMGWSRFCRASGTAVALGGGLLLLVTFVLIVVQVSDDTGAMALLLAFAVVLISVLFWAALYTSRFGLQGIYRSQSSKETFTTYDESFDFYGEDEPEPGTPTVSEPEVMFRPDEDLVPDVEFEPEPIPEEVAPSIPGGVSRFRRLRRPFARHEVEAAVSVPIVEDEEVASVRELAVEDVLHLSADDVAEVGVLPQEEPVPEPAVEITQQSVEDVLGLADSGSGDDGDVRTRTLEEILGLPTQAELESGAEDEAESPAGKQESS